MFSVGRLLMAVVIGLLVYTAFFAVPPGARADGQFDPEKVAEATMLFDTSGKDPNSAAITKLLVESYRALQRALAQQRQRL